MSNTTNFYTKDASNNLVDIITLYDRSAPGTQTTNFITNGTGYTNTNKDLGQIFTPYIYGANSINFFNFSSGATSDLGSKFAQIGKASKYTATGTYVVSSNSTYNTIIKFTSSGTIKFNSSAITARTLLVGGGGSGGIGQIVYGRMPLLSGGGGGGGGVGIGNISFNQSTSYTITVGVGGANSSISGTNVSETAYAGGNGISFSKTLDVDINNAQAYSSVILPTSGGSGGGGGMSGYYSSSLSFPNGQSFNLSKNNGGTSTPGSGAFLTYYGNSGGTVPVLTWQYCGSAGGGGAGAAGKDSVFSYTDKNSNQNLYGPGNGGSGILFDVTNSYYGGGGGGGYNETTTTIDSGIYIYGTGGLGGGGNGADIANIAASSWMGGGTKTNGSNGTPNTGGGGGGARRADTTVAKTNTNNDAGGIGGSGVCIIAFNI